MMNNIEVKMIGDIIDMSMEDFEENLVSQKVNIGTMNNLILLLESAYNELRTRKDEVIKLVADGKYKKEDPIIDNSLKGLYAELTKTEQKITFLKERVKELIDVG